MEKKKVWVVFASETPTMDPVFKVFERQDDARHYRSALAIKDLIREGVIRQDEIAETMKMMLGVCKGDSYPIESALLDTANAITERTIYLSGCEVE